MGAREVQGALRPRVSFSPQPHGLCHQPTPSLAHLLPHYPILPQGPCPTVYMLALSCLTVPELMAPKPRGSTRASFSSTFRLPSPYPELPTARPKALGGQQAVPSNAAPQRAWWGRHGQCAGEICVSGPFPGNGTSEGRCRPGLAEMLAQRCLTLAELAPASKALSQTPQVTVLHCTDEETEAQ